MARRLAQVHTINDALVDGQEWISASSSDELERMLRDETSRHPDVMLHGLLTGDEQAYLEWVVELLQRLSGMSYAMVGELQGEDSDRIRVLEIRTPEGRGQPFDYDLDPSPCSNVVGKSACIYPAGVATLFPDDELLEQMGIESYVGLPFFDPGGRPVGLVVLLDQQRLTPSRMRRALDLEVALRPRIESLLVNRRSRRDLEMLSAPRLHPGQAEPAARLSLTFSQAMNVRAAFIAVPADGGQMRLEVLAVDGRLCASPDVLVAEPPPPSGASLLIADELGRRWPTLATLMPFDARASLTLVLADRQGRTLGWLGLVHDRPLNDRIGEQPVVHAFTQQVGFELRRRHLDEERRLTERRLSEFQRVESLGILAGGVAHDFNNLLVGVLGNVDLALLDLSEGADSEEIHTSLVDVRDAACSAMHLCRQMLAYSGRGTVESARFEVGAQVEELIRLLRASIPRSIELVVGRTVPRAWVDGDVVQIRQVLMNLITNAGDAIGTGEGRITVDFEHVVLTAEQEPVVGVTGPLAPGHYLRLSVRDDGCGMDEATRSRIFDPLFSTKPSGHGLGLAAMLGIVRSHGGTLIVDSELGVGSCFTIYLPGSSA